MEKMIKVNVAFKFLAICVIKLNFTRAAVFLQILEQDDGKYKLIIWVNEKPN